VCFGFAGAEFFKKILGFFIKLLRTLYSGFINSFYNNLIKNKEVITYEQD